MTEPVTLETVQKLADGDTIGVTVAFENEKRRYHVLAGTVTSEPTSKPELEEAFDEYDTARILTFDANLWWSLSNGVSTDRSYRVRDRSPYQAFLGDPPQEAPSCALELTRDGTITLVNPSPIWRQSRVYFYDTRPCGTVIKLNSNSLLDPRHLLPDRYNHPL